MEEFLHNYVKTSPVFLNSEHTIIPHPQQNVFYIAETIEATRQNLLNSPTPNLESYCIHANTLSTPLLL